MRGNRRLVRHANDFRIKKKKWNRMLSCAVYHRLAINSLMMMDALCIQHCVEQAKQTGAGTYLAKTNAAITLLSKLWYNGIDTVYRSKVRINIASETTSFLTFLSVLPRFVSLQITIESTTCGHRTTSSALRFSLWILNADSFIK